MEKSTKIKKEKSRKVSSGPLREKERTKEKLITAVGKVLQKNGYAGLNVASVSKAAGLDRKLVYSYFGTLNNLVETFLRQKDHWNNKAKLEINRLEGNPQTIDAEAVSALLLGQFEAMLGDEVLQKIIHWEIGEKNDILQKLADSREEMAERLLKYLDPHFDQSSIDLRAILALQVGGLYYLSLHGASNGSTFCGIKTNEPDGRTRIEDALQWIIKNSFEKADFKNSGQYMAQS